MDNQFEHDEEYLEYTQKKKQRAKKRKRKRIFQLILSCVFIVFVFSVVINAAFENSNITDDESTKVSLVTKNPTSSLGSNRKEDFLTVLVCVTDEDEIRTDAMVLVAFDKKNKTLSLLNIPRDTYSDATRNNKKITAAYINGIEHTLEVVSDTVGFMPDKYAVLNFSAVEKIVDKIGGIEYEVPFIMKYDDPVQDLHIDLQEGLQTLSGEQVVHLLRWRKNNYGLEPKYYINGDLGRIETFQNFAQEASKQVLKPVNIVKLPSLVKIAFNSLETDLTFAESLWIANNALKLDAINTHTLAGEDKYIGGVSYYLPEEEGILEVVNAEFNPYFKDITKLDLLKP